MRQYIEKREGQLKSDFTELLRKRPAKFLVFRIATAGAPDRAVVGKGMTSYWECKHATPTFDDDQLQALVCTRMAVRVHCRYIIWWEDGTTKRTLIVHPRDVMTRTSWDLPVEASTEGFDHEWLCQHIERVHGIL